MKQVRDQFVEFGVVEQNPALRRNAGDVPVAVLPPDIAPGIDVPGVKLLGGTVVDAADIEHQKRVAVGEIGRGRTYSGLSVSMT
jgi:hypothetical protein